MCREIKTWERAENGEKVEGVAVGKDTEVRFDCNEAGWLACSRSRNDTHHQCLYGEVIHQSFDCLVSRYRRECKV